VLAICDADEAHARTSVASLLSSVARAESEMDLRVRAYVRSAIAEERGMAPGAKQVCSVSNTVGILENSSLDRASARDLQIPSNQKSP